MSLDMNFGPTLEESLKILDDAQDLIRDPKCWIMGRDAIDSGGGAINPQNDDAVAFCSQGAILAVTKLSGVLPFMKVAFNEAARDLGYKNMVDLNDNAEDHEVVMKMYDAAKIIHKDVRGHEIACAKAEGGQ